VVLADLDAFLAANGAKPWAWGVHDCCMVLADWLVENGHADPAASWREAYRTEAECKAIVQAHGGLVAIIDALAAAAALEPLSVPVRGAVGVIDGCRGVFDQQWGALFDGRRWQVRSARGFVGFTVSRPVLAWRV